MGTIEETLKRLQGHKVYLDTNVFIYFLDRNPDYFRLVAPHRTQTGGEISNSYRTIALFRNILLFSNP